MKKTVDEKKMDISIQNAGYVLIKEEDLPVLEDSTCVTFIIRDGILIAGVWPDGKFLWGEKELLEWEENADDDIIKLP